MSKIIDLNVGETAQHKRAYAVYCSLDPELSAGEREQAVAARLGVDSDDVHSWASFFHWEERATQDAQTIQKGMEARSRKDKLRGSVEALANRISGLLSDDRTFKNIVIDDGKTLSQLAGAMDKLVHTICMLDGTAVDAVVIKSDKPLSDYSDEELAALVAEGRARAAARTGDEGPDAA
jgi:hypothetical protein